MQKSRREFLNRSMLSAAGALGAANSAAAAASAGPGIRVPNAIPAALQSPARKAAFPMRGAQVFARTAAGVCALYGQGCDDSTPCCSGTQCTYSPTNTACTPGQQGCTCYNPM